MVGNQSSRTDCVYDTNFKCCAQVLLLTCQLSPDFPTASFRWSNMKHHHCATGHIVRYPCMWLHASFSVIRTVFHIENGFPFILINVLRRLIHVSVMMVLRTPISAKYCWFGWWIGAWSTPSHHPTQLCDIYISGYKYTLISEWTRLFGPLPILDNLISGAVCYFCTTISVFCEIYTLRMRVVGHAAILWVVLFYAVVRSWACCICPHQMALAVFRSLEKPSMNCTCHMLHTF